MIKITKKDLSWSYLAEILQFGSNLLLLPLILRKLEPSDLAIWFIYLAITRLANLFDFGFQGNIMRNITYVFSGATNLQKKGIDYNANISDIDYNLLKSVIRAIKSIYSIIALLTFAFLLIGGSFYINSITVNGIFQNNKILYSWLLVVVATTFNIYYLYYTPLLMGRGLVKVSKKVSIYSNIFYMSSAILLLSLGYGLIGISIAFLVQSLSIRIFSYNYFYDTNLKQILQKAHFSLSKKELISILWSNSWKMGVVSIGAFLILQANTLILPKFESLLIVAQYGLTLQVINFLYRISTIHFNTYFPQLSSNRIKNDRNEIIKGIGTSLFVFIATFGLGSIGLLLFGNNILILIGSKTFIFSFNMLASMLVMFFLEANHSISAQIITSKNEVPFYIPAIITGVIIVFISLLLFNFTNLGIWSIILAQFFVQLSYNNWKWPLWVLRDLNTNYRELLTKGFNNIIYQLKWI